MSRRRISLADLRRLLEENQVSAEFISMNASEVREIEEGASRSTESSFDDDDSVDLEVDPLVEAAVEIFGAEVRAIRRDHDEEVVLVNGDEEMRFVQFHPPEWPVPAPRRASARELFVSGYTICIRNPDAKAMLAELLNDVDEQIAKHPDSPWWRRWVQVMTVLSIAGQLGLFLVRSLRTIRPLRWFLTPPA